MTRVLHVASLLEAVFAILLIFFSLDPHAPNFGPLFVVLVFSIFSSKKKKKKLLHSPFRTFTKILTQVRRRSVKIMGGHVLSRSHFFRPWLRRPLTPFLYRPIEVCVYGTSFFFFFLSHHVSICIYICFQNIQDPLHEFKIYI
ncbi:hypothetical protein Tsubulata_012328 [Turnera subulata]|uniref:Uncharacterized protein n=1 Tax=Turnera subulata TaxID=218843 RepID=A0A9Q0G2I7_9ROSI|nr:hypothetical protein Tsubulata_012328 [Turnera subulata]